MEKETTLTKEFIPYNEAKELKELGFNEPCLAQYRKYETGKADLDIGFSKNEIIMQFHKLSKFCSAPTWRQAFKFFREKYKLSGTPTHQSYEIYNLISEECINEVYPIDTHEEAELSCLKRLIEIAR